MSAIIRAIKANIHTSNTNKNSNKYAILNGNFGVIDTRAKNILVDMTGMPKGEMIACLKDMAIKTPWNRGGYQQWNHTAYISEEVVNFLSPNQRGKDKVRISLYGETIYLSREKGDKVYRVEVWSR